MTEISRRRTAPQKVRPRLGGAVVPARGGRRLEGAGISAAEWPAAEPAGSHLGRYALWPRARYPDGRRESRSYRRFLGCPRKLIFNLSLSIFASRQFTV